MTNPMNLIKSLIRWAVISGFSDDDTDFPIHKMEYMGKVADGVPWYPFGYHANPGAGELALMLAVNGDFENRVVFPGSPKDRLGDLMPTPLAEGEVIMYHPLTKSYLHFKANGDIEIDSQKDVNIRVVGNMLADVEGNLTADIEGNLDVDAAGTVDIDSVGKTTITGAGEVKIDGAAKVDISASSIIASDGGVVEKLCNETFLATYNNHSHPGGNLTPIAVVDTDTTTVLKGE